MGQFDKMLGRADIQKVGQFIQYESTLNVKSKKNPDEREKQAREILKQGMKENVPEDALDRVMETVFQYAETYAMLHFSVGMKAGAKLIFQLLCDGNRTEKVLSGHMEQSLDETLQEDQEYMELREEYHEVLKRLKKVLETGEENANLIMRLDDTVGAYSNRYGEVAAMLAFHDGLEVGLEHRKCMKDL